MGFHQRQLISQEQPNHRFGECGGRGARGEHGGGGGGKSKTGSSTVVVDHCVKKRCSHLVLHLKDVDLALFFFLPARLPACIQL